MKIFLSLMFVFLFAAGGFAEMYAQGSDSVSVPKYEMKQYFMVFLKRGAERGQDSPKAQEIQAGHLAHIVKMVSDCKLLIAGPFGDDGDLRGIFILDVATKEDAESLCKQYPAVIAGRLAYEIKPWWSAKNSCLK